MNVDDLIADSESDPYFFFDVAPAAMMLVNNEGILVRANQQLCVLIEQKQGALSGASLDRVLVLDENDEDWWFDYFWDEGEFSDVEVGVVTATGRRVDALISGRQIVFGNSEPLMMCFIKAVDQVKRHQRVLYDARMSAEQANLSKSRFLSHITHELKTPLNGIMGYAQLIAHGHCPEPIGCVDFAKRIHASGQDLLMLINNLLDLSRMELTEFHVDIQSVDVHEAIGSVITSIYPLLKAKNISCKTDLMPGEIMVAADFMRLKQVLLNLISNAIKYSQVDGEISCLTEILNDQYVRVSVRDFGAGIREDQLDGIFSPFERLGQEHRDIEGTGIGLTISKLLMEMMAGKIAVTSTVNEGSVFYIDLPLDDLKLGKRLD